MKVMRIEQWGKELQGRETVLPSPKRSEALVKVEGCGVCHTDIHIIAGSYDLGFGLTRKYDSKSAVLKDTAYV
ncbi:MAG: hypothetical protein ACHQ1H_05265 [Nitrososphaerales archaeon]